jgi:hypothetical protein
MNRIDPDPVACTIATLVMFAVAAIILSLPPHVSRPTLPHTRSIVKDTVSPVDRPAPSRHADGWDTGP